MATHNIIEVFLEDQFQNTFQLFPYKDKQLLENGKYREYALGQISKAKKTFWAVIFSVLILSYFAIMSFAEYGADPNGFDLTFGLMTWVALIGILLYAAKEYYTIKSSMLLLIKLLDQKENESAD